ncbi:hypothetical protein [Mycobacteroides abscessus]|uniref:hypothetical protein n=1 Tax=Mycobacteroides abscessus TaxID=36809 RepID=UPI00188F2031|nr:hypothetical protein [Mycobacteroides abscessus]
MGEVRGLREGGGHVSASRLEAETKPSPTDYVGNSGETQHQIYAMTDGVSDAEFESAATTAIPTIADLRVCHPQFS